jgi:hypothetical protein
VHARNSTIAPDFALFRRYPALDNVRGAGGGALEMQPLDARQILQALVQGLDPVSGAELPAATPLQHAEVIQALLAAISALEAHAARTRRRSGAAL